MNKKIINTVFFLIPLLTFAHGEDVLVWFGIELIVWIGFIIYITIITIKLKYRLSILIVFLITQAIIFYTTNDISYTKNRLFINSLSGIVPIVTVFLTHLLNIRHVKRKSIN